VSGGPAAVAVVGHVEWVEFAIVDRLPAAGDIVAATEPTFLEPGGGGAVAAVQLARLAGDALFLTSVGDDTAGECAARELAERHGVDVHAAVHDVGQRRAFTHLAADGERTITVLGGRHVPLGDDDLPWDRVAACDAVYFTGGDVAALQRARAARVLVATPRARDALVGGGVLVDVLVASATDEGERIEDLDPPPKLVVLTEGAEGGRWEAADGASGRWDPVAPPAEPVDAYGCGDTFAAALTLALGRDLGLDAALAFAATCGAHVLTGRGPYGSDLPPAP
jgi:ribokinase